MDCELSRKLMSSYIDKDINDIDKKELESHLSLCEECMKEYKLLLSVVQSCNSIEEKELPGDFYKRIHEELKILDNRKSKVRRFRLNWKWASGVAAMFLVTVIGLANLPKVLSKGMLNTDIGGYPMESADAGEFDTYGTASNDGSSMSRKESGVQYNRTNNISFNQQSEDFNDEAKTKEQDKLYERKIIVNGSISIDVMEFDEKVKEITDCAERHGGYIESSNIDNSSYQYTEGKKQNYKTGYISIRIPFNKFKILIDEIKIMGDVKNESTNSINITESYYDTTTRIENLKVQEGRLRELLALAKNVDEILKIENELNRVRNDIDISSTDVRRWDKEVSLSSLYVELRETKDVGLAGIDATTTWGKAYKGFIKAVNRVIRSAEAVFIFTIASFPYLIVLFIILLLSYKVLRRIKSRKRQ